MNLTRSNMGALLARAFVILGLFGILVTPSYAVVNNYDQAQRAASVLGGHLMRIAKKVNQGFEPPAAAITDATNRKNEIVHFAESRIAAIDTVRAPLLAELTTLEASLSGAADAGTSATIQGQIDAVNAHLAPLNAERSKLKKIYLKLAVVAAGIIDDVDRNAFTGYTPGSPLAQRLRDWRIYLENVQQEENAVSRQRLLNGQRAFGYLLLNATEAELGQIATDYGAAMDAEIEESGKNARYLIASAAHARQLAVQVGDSAHAPNVLAPNVALAFARAHYEDSTGNMRFFGAPSGFDNPIHHVSVAEIGHGMVGGDPALLAWGVPDQTNSGVVVRVTNVNNYLDWLNTTHYGGNLHPWVRDSLERHVLVHTIDHGNLRDKIGVPGSHAEVQALNYLVREIYVNRGWNMDDLTHMDDLVPHIVVATYDFSVSRENPGLYSNRGLAFETCQNCGGGMHSGVATMTGSVRSTHASGTCGTPNFVPQALLDMFDAI